MKALSYFHGTTAMGRKGGKTRRVLQTLNRSRGVCVSASAWAVPGSPEAFQAVGETSPLLSF